MSDMKLFENYLKGEYVGAFSEEKPFGPHVRKCVCPPCHAVFLADLAKRQENHKAANAKLTPEQLKNRKKLASEILARVINNPKPSRKVAPAKVTVGSRVIVRTKDEVSLNEGRIGTVVEMPGPSKKYGGRPAERIEILLDATADYEWETMWTDNGQWGWLELVK
jgi:hypothetical protein